MVLFIGRQANYYHRLGPWVKATKRDIFQVSLEGPKAYGVTAKPNLYLFQIDDSCL